MCHATSHLNRSARSRISLYLEFNSPNSEKFDSIPLMATENKNDVVHHRISSSSVCAAVNGSESIALPNGDRKISVNILDY